MAYMKGVCFKTFLFQLHILLLGSGVKCISRYWLWLKGGGGGRERQRSREREDTGACEEVAHNEVKSREKMF